MSFLADDIAAAEGRNETRSHKSRCWAGADQGGQCMHKGDWEAYAGLCEGCYTSLIGDKR